MLETVKKVRKAVIPAAGLGTRFLPATKAQPKEMLPIVDKPAIQYIVEEARASGIEDILIITGRNKRAIEDHFDRSLELELMLKRSGKHELLEMVNEISGITIHFVRQKEPKGLGHAIWCAKNFVGDEPFAVLLGDDIVDSAVPCLQQLISAYEEFGGSILGCQEVAAAKVSSYGIVNPEYVNEKISRVLGMVEKPATADAPSRLAVLGRYIIEPEIFMLLEHTLPGKNGEIQLTDALRELAERKPMYALKFDGRRYDTGDKEGYLEAIVDFALQRPDLRDEFLKYITSKIGK